MVSLMSLSDKFKVNKNKEDQQILDKAQSLLIRTKIELAKLADLGETLPVELKFSLLKETGCVVSYKFCDLLKGYLDSEGLQLLSFNCGSPYDTIRFTVNLK
jgi:hypothetical protein